MMLPNVFLEFWTILSKLMLHVCTFFQIFSNFVKRVGNVDQSIFVIDKNEKQQIRSSFLINTFSTSEIGISLCHFLFHTSKREDLVLKDDFFWHHRSDCFIIFLSNVGIKVSSMQRGGWSYPPV